jgi:hypothetical protein
MQHVLYTKGADTVMLPLCTAFHPGASRLETAVGATATEDLDRYAKYGPPPLIVSYNRTFTFLSCVLFLVLSFFCPAY